MGLAKGTVAGLLAGVSKLNAAQDQLEDASPASGGTITSKRLKVPVPASAASLVAAANPQKAQAGAPLPSLASLADRLDLCDHLYQDGDAFVPANGRAYSVAAYDGMVYVAAALQPKSKETDQSVETPAVRILAI